MVANTNHAACFTVDLPGRLTWELQHLRDTAWYESLAVSSCLCNLTFTTGPRSLEHSMSVSSKYKRLITALHDIVRTCSALLFNLADSSFSPQPFLYIQLTNFIIHLWQSEDLKFLSTIKHRSRNYASPNMIYVSP